MNCFGTIGHDNCPHMKMVDRILIPISVDALRGGANCSIVLYYLLYWSNTVCPDLAKFHHWVNFKSLWQFFNWYLPNVLANFGKICRVLGSFSWFGEFFMVANRQIL